MFLYGERPMFHIFFPVYLLGPDGVTPLPGGSFLLCLATSSGDRPPPPPPAAAAGGTTTAGTDFALHGEVLGVLLHRSWRCSTDHAGM